MMDGRMWAAQATHFIGCHRVVLVDPPGHGGSDALSRNFSFDECARCIVDLLDALQIERTHWVGNSWGGMIGGTVAAQYPDQSEERRVGHGCVRTGRSGWCGYT